MSFPLASTTKDILRLGDGSGPFEVRGAGLDLHRGNATVNSTEYSTTLYTTEAALVIRSHAREHAVLLFTSHDSLGFDTFRCILGNV